MTETQVTMTENTTKTIENRGFCKGSYLRVCSARTRSPARFCASAAGRPSAQSDREKTTRPFETIILKKMKKFVKKFKKKHVTTSNTISLNQ